MADKKESGSFHVVELILEPPVWVGVGSERQTVENKDLLWGFNLTQLWVLVKKWMPGCPLCICCWTWSHCRSSGATIRKESWTWSWGWPGIHTNKLEPTPVSQGLPGQCCGWPATEAGARCHGATHTPGQNREAEGGNWQELEELLVQEAVADFC